MIIRKDDQILSYLEDTSNLKGKAASVYVPDNESEVLDCIRDVLGNNSSLTLSGARTGTTGGCVPYQGSILSLEKLNRVIGIDVEQKRIKLEAGVLLSDLEKEANKHNLSLRACPTESLASIGGAISTAASGVRGFGYGSIRRYITELTVILTTGKRLLIPRNKFFANQREFKFQCQGCDYEFTLPSYSRPQVKSQAGYFIKDNMDLIDLFIGSEGTLGVITACELSLQEIPHAVFDGLVFFSKEKKALEFVQTIKSAKDKPKPASLEFFDSHSLNLLRSSYSFIPQAQAAVYFEQEVSSPDLNDCLIEAWQALIEESGAFDEAIFADTPQERKKVFELRHAVPELINEFLRAHNQLKVSSDIAVPEQHLEEMYFFYQAKAKESGLGYVNFGHIGESHLHFNFLPRNDTEYSRAKEYMVIFAKKALSLGGTISAEHGIGKIKKPYFGLMYTKEQIKEMAGLKKYFDPYCILNRDNIFDADILGEI